MPVRSTTTAARRQRCAAALAGPLLATTVAAAIGASPAVAAVDGVHRVEARSVTDSSPRKSVRAFCPAGERVIGGGAEIDSASHRITLTEARPDLGTLDAYVVSAAETPNQTALGWSVTAYAMCAKPIAGLNLAVASSSHSSATRQATAAVCPSGQRVIGSGAEIDDKSGHVALQVARPSHPGDIARAEAQEAHAPHPGAWHVTAYALCAPTPAGYEVVFGESLLRGSEGLKTAFARCAPFKQLLSSGAAISNLAPGQVALRTMRPETPFRRTVAEATETSPLAASWDFIVASSVCAY
jgi:hypothetical protein